MEFEFASCAHIIAQPKASQPSQLVKNAIPFGAVRIWRYPCMKRFGVRNTRVQSAFSEFSGNSVYKPRTRKLLFVSILLFQRLSESASCVFSMSPQSSTPLASICRRSLRRASTGCAHCSRNLLNIDLLMRLRQLAQSAAMSPCRTSPGSRIKLELGVDRGGVQRGGYSEMDFSTISIPVLRRNSSGDSPPTMTKV